MKNWKILFVCLCGISLTACGGGSSEEPPVTPKSNTAPVADAGDDQEVSDYTQITLSGGGSADADGDSLTYAWVHVSGDIEVSFSSTNEENVQVAIPNVDEDVTLQFELTVFDGTDSSVDTVTVNVTADDDAPVVEAEDEPTINPGTVIVLDASASFDPEGNKLTYVWSIGAGSEAEFLSADGQKADSLEAATGSLFVPAQEAGSIVSVTLDINDGELSASKTIAVTVSECVDGHGHVFVECADPGWLGLSAWEQDKVFFDVVKEYFSGSTDNHVQWSVQNLNDGEHNNVIDVTFNSDDSNGFFRFLSANVTNATGDTDMSEFTDGNLIFDVRRLDELDTDLIVRLECHWPCESDEMIVATDANGDWTTNSIAVADLVNSGLNLASVDVGFQIYPAWGAQEGAHIQIDNIRWEAATCGASDGVVFSDCLGPRWGGFGAWDEIDGNYFDGDTTKHITWETIYSGDPERNYVVEIGFNNDTSGTFYVYSLNLPAETADLSAYLNGQLAFDVKVLDYGTNTGGLVTLVGCVHPCQSGDFEVAPPVGEWTEVAISVADMVATGLDLDNVSAGFIILPVWEDQTGVQLQVDNIRWETEIQ